MMDLERTASINRYDPEPVAALMAVLNAPNDPMVLAPSVLITEMQTVMISASITAYSTAAGPSSLTRKWRRRGFMVFIDGPASLEVSSDTSSTKYA
jgi:hypothetical protein